MNNYSDNYPEFYKKIKEKIFQYTGRIDIHHIGSTSIPGMKGKGIIDILVGYDSNKNSKKLATQLKKAGFIFQKSSSKDRIFLSNKIEETKEGDFHIHLTRKNSLEYVNLLKFKKILLKFPKSCEEYLFAKQISEKSAQGKRKLYKENKSVVIEKILRDYSKLK